MIKNIFAMLIFLSLFVSSAFAQANVTTNSSTYCLDDNVLVIETERVICIEGQCDNVERVWQNVCKWGCNYDRDECFADPIARYGFVAVIILVIIGALILGWKYL